MAVQHADPTQGSDGACDRPACGRRSPQHARVRSHESWSRRTLARVSLRGAASRQVGENEGIGRRGKPREGWKWTQVEGGGG
jgi:hypothetical protein